MLPSRILFPATRRLLSRGLHFATKTAPLIQPSAKMGSTESYGNFDLVKRVKLSFTDVHISRWRSRVTGLSVVHLDCDAPIVNGYFAVGTEIFNDSGCPHTLEHLVFMGSEKYPYKGIIDQLANRGFSNGTNAWTDTDNTVYTVSTAGGQGFLQLLPIYVDHILYPTITDAGFVTEVHHIDSKGHNAGVVYSEMQGRENTSGDLMALGLQRLLNTDVSAYRSETGGLMEALRELKVEQIRKYHAKYYVPHNLSLIVTGKLSGGTQSLLEVVQTKVEPSIIAHGQAEGPRPPGWKRPFLETPTATRGDLKSSVATVEFPEKDESMGELAIGQRGPPPEDQLTARAIDILGNYLTSSSVAPLTKKFVEIENPLCSYIYFSEETRAEYIDLNIYIGSVPTEHLESFEGELQKSFKDILENTGIDMERMRMVINRNERQLKSKLEASKGDIFSGAVISDFLLGPEDGSGMEPSMDEIGYYNALRSWTADDWKTLLAKYYVDKPRVLIIGKPSAALAEKLEVDEKRRIAEQVEKLGPEGLARAAKLLEDAKAEHERPIPLEILQSFPVPDVKSISWIPVQSACDGKNSTPTLPGRHPDNAPLVAHLDTDGPSLPFFVQYDHVQSDFVTVHAYLSLATLPPRLRPLVSTYLSAFFSLPITRASGERLTHEEVVNKLDNETVSYECTLGVAGYFSETLRVSIKVETIMYGTAVQWLRDLIFGAAFDKDRLQVTLAKIQQSIPELKRDGNTIMSAVSGEMLYDETSTSRSNGVTVQMEVVPKLIKELRETPEGILADFEALRKEITRPTGVRFSVTGNVNALEKPRTIWRKCFEETATLPHGKELSPVKVAEQTLSAIGKKPVKKAVVVNLPTIESSYTIHTTKGIQGFAHPRYPAQRVALEVLNATESFLWRYIRGAGLAYGASMSLDIEAGLLSFSLYRSANCMEAFHQGAKVLQGLADGSIPLDETVLDAAKSSIVYGVTKGVSTPGRAAMMSFANQAFKGVSQNHNTDLLEKFQAVTKEEVLSVLQEDFLRVFNPESSVAVVVTAPSKVDDIANDMTTLGFAVEKRALQVDPEEMEVDADTDSGTETGTEGEANDDR